ncbi:MAG: MFS transporter [Clostridia bacterium]
MSEKNRRRFIFSNYYSFFVMGMVLLAIGAILPYLMAEYNLDYRQGGLVLGLLSAGNLLGYIAGSFSDRLGRKRMVLFSSICFVFGYSGVLLTQASLWLNVSVFVVGMGFGILNSVAHTIINDSGNADGKTMNLLHMLFAVGAFATPFLVGMTVRFGINWRYAVAFVILASAVLFLTLALMPIQAASEHAKGNRKGWAGILSVLSRPRIFLFIAILFFYVGAENGINGWVVTYLLNAGIMNETAAQSALSFFWLAIIGGRFFWAFMSRHLSHEKILFAGGSTGLLFFVLFLLLKTPVVIFLCMIGMGLFLSSAFPNTMANATYLTKGSVAGNSIILAGASIGGTAIPYLNGLVAQSRGIEAGMTLILLSVAVFTGLTGWNCIIGEKNRKAKTLPQGSG